MRGKAEDKFWGAGKRRGKLRGWEGEELKGRGRGEGGRCGRGETSEERGRGGDWKRGRGREEESYTCMKPRDTALREL